MDDGGPELTQQERAVLIGLEQSLARGELVPERGCTAVVPRPVWRWARRSAITAALGAIVVGVTGLVHADPGARELLVAGLVLVVVAASVLLVVLALPFAHGLLISWKVRRLGGSRRFARRRAGAPQPRGACQDM